MAELFLMAASAVAALLTLYSGFGLGTLLLPVFALLLGRVAVAIAATAVVHLANNLFKLGLVAKHARWGVVARFGVTAALASFAGAALLARISGLPVWVRYTLGARVCEITPLDLVIAGLMLAFALLELLPSLRALSFSPRLLPLGGVLSGFFGGLSGHQGPLRSAFLIRCGLSKEEFVGTGAVCAVIVDTVRLLVYGWLFHGRSFQAVLDSGQGHLVALGVASAFLGSWLGTRWLKKITLDTVQRIVGALLILMALGIGSGIL